MAEETLILVMLVIVMLVGSYMAGSIPLNMKLNEEKLKIVTVLGAGLLVGTALTVIIPEGIQSLYMDTNIVKFPRHESATVNNIQQPVSEKLNKDEHIHNRDHSRAIGLSLVLGFVFMMLIDQISQRKRSGDKNITATLGLVVHAAADGVALGAAATTSHQDVEIIVFLAIMLHKAPAAFGLLSFLLHEKIERQRIRKHLAIFSLSAPLLTLLTYFGIGKEQKETLNSINATGIAMLFSGGTFLYVATVHVLPELTQNSAGAHHHTTTSQHSQYEYRALEEAVNAEIDTSDKQTTAQVHNSNSGLHWSELTILIGDALMPLIITFGHQH